MIHPFMPDLANKSLEELQTTLQGLYSKLTYAHRMQNSALIQQLNMVIDGYKSECNKRLDDLYKKQNMKDRINISKNNDSKNI